MTGVVTKGRWPLWTDDRESICIIIMIIHYTALSTARRWRCALGLGPLDRTMAGAGPIACMASAHGHAMGMRMVTYRVSGIGYKCRSMILYSGA